MRGFDDYRTAGYECCTGLAGYQEEGEVPRQYAGHDAYGLLGKQYGLIGAVAGNYLALYVAGHVLKVGNGGSDFYRRPVARLALLAHDDLGELLLAGLYASGKFQQILCALNGGGLCPRLLGGTCCVECAVHVVYGTFRLPGDYFFGGGVQYVNPAAVRRFAELAVNVHF